MVNKSPHPRKILQDQLTVFVSSRARLTNASAIAIIAADYTLSATELLKMASLSPRDSSKGEARSAPLQVTLDYYRELHCCSLDRDTEFSWIRSAVFLVSYLLLLTDMFRTTLAIGQVHYAQVEPSVFMSFGPYGYSLAHMLRNDTSDETASVWAYKYDTTSVAIRAVARFFNLSSWPPCMVYESQCEETTIGYPIVIGMLDSLVESVSQRKVKRKDERPGITLRTENVYYDRLHNYIFPFFFETKKVRTVQALYYDMETVANERFQFCSRDSSQPYVCGDNWTNFEVTCALQNAPCTKSRTIWKDILINAKDLAKANPDLELDMLLVEGYEDRGLGSLSLQGRQQFDIIVITRIRNCTQRANSNLCTTVAVNDHRYEGETLSTDIVDWYYVIASIRIAGQSYAYLRVILFFMCCYKARLAEPEFLHASNAARIRATLGTIFTVPSQVVSYGSMIHVFAYTIAHLIDSSIVYAEVFDRFTSLVGKFHLDIHLFIRVATISMRSIWVLATVFHVLLFLRTRVCFDPLSKGIPSIPEFMLSATAFLTICAQYRSISFRDSTVVSILEVIPSGRGRKIRSFRYNNTRQMAYLFCLGDTLDAKTLSASFFVVTVCSFIIYGILWVLSKLRIVAPYELGLWPHVIVSYAAGTLWPLNELMVSWHGFIVIPVGAKRHFSIRPMDSSTGKSAHVAVVSSNCKNTSTSFIASKSKESLVIQNSIAYLDGRTPVVNATLYLMNLTVLSDPIVLVRLYWFGGQEIGIYRSLRNFDQLYFLPFGAENPAQICMIDYSQIELLGVANTMNLPWTILLQCGYSSSYESGPFPCAVSVLHFITFLRRLVPITKGIPGIPEFTLSATAFLTISAHFRSLSFRNADVISILEVVPSAKIRNIRAGRYDNTKHLAYLFCLGDSFDVNFLTASFLTVTAILILIYGFMWILHKLRIVNSYELTLWPHTIVSYAVCALWPVNALMVCWHGFIVTPVGVERYLPVDPTNFKKKNSIWSRLGKMKATSLIVNKSEENRVIQNSIAYLDGRSSAVNATLYLMNLIVMSDPIVLSRLYFFGGQEIGIYRSTRFYDQLYFLPLEIEKSEQNFKTDCLQMELVGVVNTMGLPWIGLLQYG